MPQPIKGQDGHLGFLIDQKNTPNLEEDIEILPPVKFYWIAFSGYKNCQKCLPNQRSGRPSWFSNRPKNTILIEDVEILLPVKFYWIPFSGFRWAVKNSQPITGQDGHLGFQISPKNTNFEEDVGITIGPNNPNLIEDVEISFLDKIRWIHQSGFRPEVENVSANQRSVRASWFSDRTDKKKLGRGHWNIPSCQVLENSHLGFPICQNNPKLPEEVEILLPVKFRWIPFSVLREEVENVSAN